MSTTQQDKPGGKPRKRPRKPDQRGPRGEQPQTPKPDRQDESRIEAMIASNEAPATPLAVPIEVPLMGEVLPPDVLSVHAAAAADNYPLNLQAIINAYADYSMKSFEQGRFLVEKLVAVRSFDQAIELQNEFARQAFANFVAHSQKMYELYGALAEQLLRPWERVAARMTGAERYTW